MFVTTLRTRLGFRLHYGNDTSGADFPWYKGPHARCERPSRRVDGASCYSPGKALQGFILWPQRVQLVAHAGILGGELLHLLLQVCLLLLQLFFLCYPLHSAARCITTILKGAAALLQLDDLFLRQTTEMLVQLPHRHGDQFFVGKTGAILPWLPLYLNTNKYTH